MELNTTQEEVQSVASKSCKDGCKYACTERSVTHKLSMNRFPAPPKIPLLRQQIHRNEKRQNVSLEYIEKNYVGLNLFYSTLTIRTVEWRERMSVGQLISSAGGQLGLCAGISFITLAQAIWYICAAFSSGFTMIWALRWKPQTQV